jgi:hypothetical protein
VARTAAQPERLWRRATAARRSLPDFVILGTQRGGTTSLYDWMTGHPSVVPATKKEVHYFDLHYARGEPWYRTHFPVARPGRVTGEASPYLLVHPLAPERCGRDLPESTQFIVVLREPVERAVSHYWHERRLKAETEPLAAALALEESRLAGEEERLRAGGRSFAHFHFSYATRGRYAEQLERWFAHVDRSRILVVESEAMFSDAAASARIIEWLGLAPMASPFPALNEAHRTVDEAGAAADAEALRHLEESFQPDNERLFELLGYRLWGR